jgi:para-aminobenzoate synthetase/4-amino-4-deoxychorismate lyase
LRVVCGYPAGLLFERPRDVLRARTPDEAWAALARADDALDAGCCVAGYLSYELGHACNGLPERERAAPLLVLGIYDRAIEYAPFEFAEFRLGPPLARVSRRDYDERIAHLAAAIRDGDVYQVNLTMPFDCAFAGDASALFGQMAAASHAPYAAFVDDGDTAIASASPEAFLRFERGSLLAKPMKGTSPPDELAPLFDAKNRAEHVMIVDLLRNDLHRLSDDVVVESLCDVERYPTFATLTSSIRARFEKTPLLTDVVRATFPCGSVTGAPKRAAMKQIARLEPWPREVYTGSIGYLLPDRTGWFNVAIRTLQIDRAGDAARYDAGGGIVADSTAAGEWDEIGIKTRFLRDIAERVTLLETFRIGIGAREATMDAHLARLFESARRLFVPCDEPEIRTRVADAHGAATAAALCRLRLAYDGALTLLTEPLQATEEPVVVRLASQTVRSGDPMLRIKSSWRAAHERAWEQAREGGAFDALLRNQRDEITEGSRTNVFARIGAALVTPALECGVLPGILRAELLARGEAREGVLRECDLRSADELYVGNSARGLLRARLLP